MRFCNYVSHTQAKPKRCGSPAATGSDTCLFHQALLLSYAHAQSRGARVPVVDDMPPAPCLRILPASEDDDIAREVNHVAQQPLVGGLPPSPGPAPKFKYVAVDRAVMRGREWQATVCSHTMAKRIANALNVYKPNREGV